MATTPNYSWVMPDPTDFVTALPADFEIFGDAVDATVEGIDDRVTDLEVITTEGDLIIGDASGDPVRLPVGAAGEVLTSDGDTVSFVAPAAAGGITLLSTTTLSGASVTISSISQAHKDLYICVTGVTNNTANGVLSFFPVHGGSRNTFGSRSTGGLVATFTGTSLVPAVAFNRNIAENHLFAFFPQYAISGIARTCHFYGGYRETTNNDFNYFGAYRSEDTDTISSFTLTNAGGTFSSGTVRIYGAS